MNDKKRIEKLEKEFIELKGIVSQKDDEIRTLKEEITKIKNDRSLQKESTYRKFIDKHFPENSKKKMVTRLFVNMVKHPIRACSLVFKIKGGNLHFGDHIADIMYLKYGKIEFPKYEKPTVSIVIPVYNQYIFTYKCLKSILKYTNDVSYEVIIGDDVSYDGTRVLDSYVKNVNVIRNKKNYGFLQNCNNATNYANGKYILFLNNDTEVTENWLSSLVSLIESDSSIGLVGSKLVFPDGILQEAGGILFNDGSGCNYGKFERADKPQFNYVRDTDYISGASIMISKELWEKIGRFDERYVPAYCEDSDLAFEVRKAGYRVVYQPKSVVIHYEGVSNGTDVNATTGLKRYQIENSEKLRQKWKKEFAKLPDSNTNRMDFTFRDRIDKKKMVLVVDHYVPEFDKDAGSRNTFQYLKMFVDKGYAVKFLPANFSYTKKYTEVLEQMGIEVLYGVEYKKNIEDWIIMNKDNIDFVYLNRPHVAADYVDFIKENTNIKIIFYGHDLHFLRENREFEITGDEYHKNESEKWKKIELDIMKKSDVVYYPSLVEKETIKEIDKSINVKAIIAYMYENLDLEKKYDINSRDGILFVGGFRHRPNIDGVLWFTKEIYPLIRKNKNVNFYIVGSNPTNEILRLNGNGIVVKGFVSDEELEHLYNTCRLVVAPLRYGAGIKGKIIEAMAKGTPIVTTSIGAEGITDSDNILKIADEAPKFAKYVCDLYDNQQELQKLMTEGLNYIQKNYSEEAAWNIIKDDFK